MENFVISWNSYSEVFHQTLMQLLSSHEFTDCLLVCEGGQLKCHKFVLSACSPWFREVLLGIDHPNPVIILQDIKYEELKALLEFVYTGNVTVCENELRRMIEVGKSLKVTGLVAPDKQFGDGGQTSGKPTIESVSGMFKGVESLNTEQYLRPDSGSDELGLDESVNVPSVSESKSFIENEDQSYFVGHNAEFDDDDEDEKDNLKVESQRVRGEGSIRGRRSFIESRPDDLADILQSIKNGTSCNWLSKKYGISVATIRKYAIAHGAPKGRNGRQKQVEKRLTEEDREAILRAVKRGVRYVQLAEMYGVSTTAISNFCKVHGCVSKRGRTRLFPSEPCITADTEEAPDSDIIVPDLVHHQFSTNNGSDSENVQPLHPEPFPRPTSGSFAVKSEEKDFESMQF